MTKFRSHFRLIIMIVFIVAALALSLIRLMKIQIVEGAELLKQSIRKTVGEQEIVAPRGEIVDINGNPIVKNEAGFCVVIEKAFFPEDFSQQNKIILKLTEILSSNEDKWNDTMPVSMEMPYNFSEDRDSDVSKMKINLRLNTYATAQNCVDKLIEKYEISDEYTESQKRIIAGVRYDMIASEFSVSNSYNFANNISQDSLAKIKELTYELEGVDVIEEPVRVYVDGTVLPHAIGTVGPIYAEEYAELKENGYKLNDKIGKSGIEKALETTLRGTSGIREVTISSDKELVETNVTKPAVSGNTVQLTIDAEFQKKCQDILEDTIEKLNSQPESPYSLGRDAKAGAIVVLDAKTGAVRALVSNPGYDINDYINNYSEVASGENNPLINRATDGLYRPGSTFKPITAIAGLNEGVITPETEVFCSGMDFKGTKMNCHYLSGHGNINVVNAITESCNFFFYETAERVGIDNLMKYEELCGLGDKLDIEIGSAKGYIASPTTLNNLGIDWTYGQLLQAGIGQSEILVTPLQMASEALTIANRGTRYSPYLVDSIWDYNHNTMISKTQPVVASQIDVKYDYVFESVVDGMKGAAKKTGGVSGVFPYAQYTLDTLPCETAIKTGSPQVTKETTNSCFIGFYPADDPEIVFAGYLELGEYSKYMIRPIIDAYYGYDTVTDNAEETTAVQNEQITDN